MLSIFKLIRKVGNFSITKCVATVAMIYNHKDLWKSIKPLKTSYFLDFAACIVVDNMNVKLIVPLH